MNEIINETRTPIEIALDIDSEGMTTAKKLYAFLEMDSSHYSRWCKANIINNEFATENEDYFYSPSMANEQGRGNFADDYRLTALIGEILKPYARISVCNPETAQFTSLLISFIVSVFILIILRIFIVFRRGQWYNHIYRSPNGRRQSV